MEVKEHLFGGGKQYSTMATTSETLIKVETLKNILVNRATGKLNENADEDYVKLRRDLVSDPQVHERLPRLLISCRNIGEFWNFIRTKFEHYSERREFLQNQFEPLLTYLEIGANDSPNSNIGVDLFTRQFPAGLPFGLHKPNLAFIPKHGTQIAMFEESMDIGVIRTNIYPDLSFQKLNESLKGQPFATAMMPNLIKTNQTDREKKLFTSYVSTHKMWTERVPVLIPQAWIQWHSSTKANLRANASAYSDDLYRVDFVAFWKNKRFAILVDDISHYAKHLGMRWDADEEAYSKRLKEDRKLRKEGWEVFRVSNWELRGEAYLPEILADLKEYLDF